MATTNCENDIVLQKTENYGALKDAHEMKRDLSHAQDDPSLLHVFFGIVGHLSLLVGSHFKLSSSQEKALDLRNWSVWPGVVDVHQVARFAAAAEADRWVQSCNLLEETILRTPPSK
ncbi:hypothetical protein MMC07_004566 [Pseudocyphellaria aurata]|nr:hypothetical protein [Pseudocyphellaria aurata]